MNYSEQLKSTQWQERRQQILERDNYRCQFCNSDSKELNVHHKVYIENRMAWDYHNTLLITLCNDCHEKLHIRLSKINNMLGFMTNEQLYFTVDIINMLQLSSPEVCLKTLEYLTSELKEKYHV